MEKKWCQTKVVLLTCASTAKTTIGCICFGLQKRNERNFEVNRRLVFPTRRIGKGHAGASKFCSVMNMPPPQKSKKSSHVIAKHAKTCCCEKHESSWKSSVCFEKKNEDGTNPINCGVSCDGTWQQGGNSSLNKCVSVMLIDSREGS